METLQSKQAREIAALAAQIKHLEKEVKQLEKQKYDAYKRIGELTSDRTAS